MYRLDPKMLALEIEMAAWRVFRRHGTKLNSKVTRGHAERDIVAELTKALINDHTCVVVTDSSGGYNPKRPAFGRDVAWPAPLDMERRARPVDAVKPESQL
jgi:hypothetical protein